MYRMIMSALDPGGKIGELWCSLMHESAMWPTHGFYQCRACGRKYPVPWSELRHTPRLQPRQSAIASFRSALLPLLLLAAVTGLPLRAADTLVVNSCPAAAVALVRYTSGQE